MGKSKATIKQEPAPQVLELQEIKVQEVKPKIKRTKTEPVASVPEVVEQPANEIVEEEETLADITTRYLTKLQEASAVLVALRNEFRTIEKRWSKEYKIAQKTNKKKKKNPNRQPSGFVKPTKISDELASFLGKEQGVEMARTQVTREINLYIRANNLQDNLNGRHINPDAKLSALLKIPDGENLTYFNLQKYMSPHFFKNVVSADV
jgi:upstream activation factor subunit UAF30